LFLALCAAGRLRADQASGCQEDKTEKPHVAIIKVRDHRHVLANLLFACQEIVLVILLLSALPHCVTFIVHPIATTVLVSFFLISQQRFQALFFLCSSLYVGMDKMQPLNYY
jgi:hypothetical protein